MHEKNPWDVQVWHLFLTEWPNMKPDTEGTGSDMELLQVLWQPKKQISCECGGAQEISAVSVHSEFQDMCGFLSLMLSRRSGQFLLWNLESFPLNFDLLFECMFI